MYRRIWIGLFFAIATLAWSARADAQWNLTAAVLVNSGNASGFTEYQRYPERYLEHLQIPYETVDVGATAPPSDLASRQLIIAGHRGLNLSQAWQNAITNAVLGGTGFVNLDWSTNIGQAAHTQAIFGATGSLAGAPGNTIVVPAAVLPDGSSPHFIAAYQLRFLGDPPGDLVYPFHNQSQALEIAPTVLSGGAGTVIARLGSEPLILASAAGSGRAVHFGTYDYLKADRFGFLMGVDDLFWRSLVWAARKPFVLRGHPRLWAVQLDDWTEGAILRTRDLYDPALTGPEAADGTGGPWRVTGNVFTDRLSPGSSERALVIADINAGQLQVSPHALHGDAGPDLYWKVPQNPPPTDAEWLDHLNQTLAWIQGNGGADKIPSISRSMVPHYWVLGDNTGFDMWHSLGFRYLTIRQKPGFTNNQGIGDPAGRIFARPFRLFELPPPGGLEDNYPLFFADEIVVGSRAGLPSQNFFHFTTSSQLADSLRYPRADFAWPGSNFNGPWSAQQSLDQLKHWTWRLWSSQVPVNLYTHDSGNLAVVSPEDRRALIQQGSQWLNANGVYHVFMEEMGAYIHARTKSTLTRAAATGGEISLTFTGNATTPDGDPVSTTVHVYDGDNEGALREVPGFAGGLTTALPLTSNPSLAVSPTAIAFTAIKGTNPSPRSLSLVNTGTGSLSWSVSDNAAWLGLTPGSGSAPSTITASVNTAGLIEGTYNASIEVSAPGAANSPQIVSVTLTITPAPPTISRISPTSGSAGGGELMQVLGTGFTPGTTISIGGFVASTVLVQSETSMLVTVQAGAVGPAQVRVSNSAGTSTAPTSYNYLQSAGVLFADAFNDGDLAGWTSSPLGGQANWNAATGALEYNGLGHTQLVAGNAAWTDYAVEAKFRLFSLANFPGGLRGRVDPLTGSGYEVWLFPATSQIALLRVTGWSIDSPGLTELGRATVPFDAANFHTLRLTFTGITIEVSYDSAPVITASDTQYAAGAVALDVSNQPIQWEDLIVLGSAATPAPTIGRVSPTDGSTDGNTLLQIEGTGFTSEATVTVGGLAATSVTFVSPTKLLAVTPPGAAGAATVIVTTSAGTANAAYTYLPASSILFADAFNDGDAAGWSVSPLGGQANWSAATGALEYNGLGHTQLYAGNPAWTDYSVEAKFRLFSLANFPGGLRGRVDPLTGGGYEAWLFPATSQIALFRVTGWSIDSPGLLELGRATVPFDATSFHTLRLTFSGTTIEVSYDGLPVITATDSQYAAGAVAFDVSNRRVLWDDVLVLGPTTPSQAPTIGRVSPTDGSTDGSTLMQIDGTGFVAGTTVTIGGAPATNITVVSPTRLLAITPPGAAGASTVVVTTPGGTANAAYNYIPASGILFANAFNDGNFAGWTISPLGGQANWNAATGALEYNGLGHTQLSAGNAAWTDYSVEAKFRLFSLANHPGGLRGRVDPLTGTGYEAWLYPATSQVALFRVTGWSIDSPGLLELGRATVPYDATSFHTLRLTFSGTTIEVSYDGLPVITASDTQYAAGAVALDVSNQRILWDDVLVLAPPTLQVIPAGLSFSGLPNTILLPQTISITNLGSGTLAWSANDNASWLTLGTTDGTAPSSVAVTVNTAGLAPGPYNATITVTASGAAGSPQPVPVALTVLQPPTLQASPASFTFSGLPNATLTPQSLSITNGGSGILIWTADDDAPWLTLGTTGGTAPSSIEVNVNTAGLAPGSYNATITVTASGAVSSPQTVLVSLTVLQPPALQASPASFTFSGLPNATLTPQSLSITNAGSGILIWTADDDAPWLTLGTTGGTAPSSIEVNVNTAGLAPGSYNATITVTASGAVSSPQTVLVSLTVLQPPALQASPASFTFSGLPDTTLTPQTLSVTNTGSGTLTWTVTDDAGWLTLGTTDGTAPSSVAVTVNTAGLAPGPYNATITVTASGAAGSPQTVPVSLTVLQPPTLQVSPTPLTFSGLPTTTLPPQTLSVTNTGSGTLAWTATDTATWLTLGTESGTAPASISVTVNTTGLPPGPYAATITVTASGADGSPQTVPVSLTVLQPPTLQVSPTPLTFSGLPTTTLPPQTLSVTNTGSGTLAWTATDTATWLTLGTESGTAPASISVTVNTTGLPPGPYAATITVTASGADGSPQTVPVSLTVLQPPTLQVSPTPLTFSGLPTTTLAPQTVSVTNTGSGTLAWTATDSATWLTLGTESGTAPSSITVTVNTTGLPPGPYAATITVTAPGADGSPQAVPVSLTVLQPPTLQVSPASFTFSGLPNATLAPQTLSITNSGTGTLTWTATDNAGWLTLGVGSGAAPSSVAVNVNTAGLAPGNYNATIAVTASGAAGSPQTVPVSLTVTGSEIIIDNALVGVQDPAGGRSFTGTWCTSAAPGPFGADSLRGCSPDTYRWTPTLTAAGSYDVYVWWTSHPNRSGQAPFTAVHAGGSTIRSFDQKVGGGAWTLHGRYSFNAGSGGYVELDNSQGQASADAVRFVRVTTGSQTIIDNAPAGIQDSTRSFTGNWCTSPASGQFSADSLYSCSLDSYRWTPTFATSGSYDVYVRWTSHPNRSSQAPFTAVHAGGTTTREFNEQTGGSAWVLHGRYTFNAGSSGYVETSSLNGQAIADAVRWVRVP